ncbi:DUF986 family protein [Mixta hanseatica]|uniref:UPF0266 membrane protein YobD n=1 Tax=Mixta hanseatica TaxID=2872648 RepID=A0ABY4R5W1_9GAMM|nr:DUF986 family protein [Mixta hanseatica]
MPLTDVVLVLFIALLLLYAIYDQWIMPRRHGKTLLQVPLQRRSKIDNIIFIGLIGNDSNLLIVFYVQIMPDDFVMQLHRF